MDTINSDEVFTFNVSPTFIKQKLDVKWWMNKINENEYNNDMISHFKYVNSKIKEKYYNILHIGLSSHTFEDVLRLTSEILFLIEEYLIDIAFSLIRKNRIQATKLLNIIFGITEEFKYLLNCDYIEGQSIFTFKLYKDTVKKLHIMNKQLNIITLLIKFKR